MLQEFDRGEAIELQCMCKGEVAMRHRACAIEWSNVSGTMGPWHYGTGTSLCCVLHMDCDRITAQGGPDVCTFA